MIEWGKRKDGQAYPKSKKGIPSSNTSPISDIYLKAKKKSKYPQMNLNEKQEGIMDFVLKKYPELTPEVLDPKQNEFNSVRMQQLRKSGHFISEGWEDWTCHQCNKIIPQYVIHYMDWGNPSKPSQEVAKMNDESWSRTSTTHLFDEHPEFVAKRLGKMGVKLG